MSQLQRSDAPPSLAARFPGLAAPAPLPLVRRTPVERWDRLSDRFRVELWAKRDDLTSEAGGNKLRKLSFLLADALERRAVRLTTAGPAGSNHVLATAREGAALGLPLRAFLVPQPPTPRAVATCRELSRLAEAIPCRSWADALARLAASAFERGTYAIPPGGSGPIGTLGYVQAALELADQIAAGEVPRPRRILLPLGTGSTAAGLSAGLLAAGLPDVRVQAVSVAPGPGRGGGLARALALDAGRRLGAGGKPSMVVDRSQAGDGYAVPTAASEAARLLLLVEQGLEVDGTYAAKALAGLVSAVGARRPGPLLFWVTCPRQQPVEDPDPATLPPPLARLFSRPRRKT